MKLRAKNEICLLAVLLVGPVKSSVSLHGTLPLCRDVEALLMNFQLISVVIEFFNAEHELSELNMKLTVFLMLCTKFTPPPSAVIGPEATPITIQTPLHYVHF